MKLSIYEIQRVFGNQTNRILLLLAFIISLTSGLLFINGVKADRVRSDGSVEIVKGIEAIELTSHYDTKYSGVVTEENLIKAQMFYNDSYDLVRDRRIITEELLEFTPLIGFLYGLKVKSDDKMAVEPWTGPDIPMAYAKDYYKLREAMIKNYTDLLINKRIANRVWEMESSINKPFIVGVNSASWGDAIQWLTMMSAIGQFFVIIASASPFPDAKDNGIQAIVSRTVRGNRYFSINKVTSVLIFSVVIYLLVSLVYLSIVYSALGDSGLNTSIQQTLAFSPANFSLRDAIGFQFLGGLVGVLALSSLSIFISILSNSVKTATSISIGLYIMNAILSIFVKPNSNIIQLLMDFSPFGVSQVFYQIPFADFIDIGRIIWKPEAVIVFGMLQMSFFSVMAIRIWNYKNRRMDGETNI